MAEDSFQREVVERHRQAWTCRLCLLTVAVCFAMPTAADVLTQIGATVESRWARAASGLFIAAAHAKKDPGVKGNGGGQPQTTNTNLQANAGGQPQNSNTDTKANVDDPSPGSSQNAGSAPGGTARNTGSVPQAQDAGPPKTLAEAMQRLLKLLQPRPPTIPPWPEAKVTRATPEDPTTLPPRGKLAQKGQATRRPSSRSVAGDILAQPGTYKPNELLVLRANTKVVARLHALGWEPSPGAAPAQGVVRFVSATQNAVAAREQLQLNFPGTHFALNFVYQLANNNMTRRAPDASAGGASCDPQRCYGPALINWRAELAACTVGVKIGIIDTAVDVAHPALAWKRLVVRRIANQEPASMEPHWHGTGVLSLLMGNPTSGVPGLVPDADYIIADAFFRNRTGKPETDTEHLLRALDVLERGGAQVVNMSFTGPRDDLVHQRLVALSLKGVVFVAAAGNGGPDAPPAYPAAYKDEVIAVTAVDRDQRLYDHANQGDYIDVAAPGVRIWTALPNSKQGLQSGTSFAAPFVTAIAAAIYKNALVPAMSDPGAPRGPKAVALAHLSAAKAVRDDKVGLGLVSAPSKCSASKEIPTAQLTPPVALSTWETRVHRASAQP